MPDASPTKWHLAHTTWFFETFILKKFVRNYQEFHPNYNFLFNSYYNKIGDRHARPERGMITRPSSAEVYEYRNHIDNKMKEYFQIKPKSDVLRLIELGIHHEQQHQELLITDIKHAFSRNPLYPKYKEPTPVKGLSLSKSDWLIHPGGLVEIGYSGEKFIFDAEGPRHKVWLEPFCLAKNPVSNREYIDFIEDGGYKKAEFWLSDGWTFCQKENWESPMYWYKNGDGTWSYYTMSGKIPINLNAPVCHVSYYEADAFARWSNARLPENPSGKLLLNHLILRVILLMLIYLIHNLQQKMELHKFMEMCGNGHKALLLLIQAINCGGAVGNIMENLCLDRWFYEVVLAPP